MLRACWLPQGQGQIEKLVASADANGDGEVSGEEFLVMMVPGTRADRE